MSKNVPALKESTAIAALDDDLFDDAGATREGASQDTMSIPFLSILQPTSPQVTEGGSEYIEGARPGMVYNSVTKEVFDVRKTPLRVVRIAFRESYVEWITRDNGGGFVSEYPVEEGIQAKTARNDKNEDIIQAGSELGKPGNTLTYTHTHYAFTLDERTGAPMPVLLTMAITQIKPSKDWNFLLNNFSYNGRPLKCFATVWELTTELKERDGNRWFIWKFSKHGETGVLDLELPENGIGKAIRLAAQRFRDGVAAGEHKADFSKATEVNPDAPDAPDGAGPSAADGEEIPF